MKLTRVLFTQSGYDRALFVRNEGVGDRSFVLAKVSIVEALVHQGEGRRGFG